MSSLAGMIGSAVVPAVAGLGVAAIAGGAMLISAGAKFTAFIRSETERLSGFSGAAAGALARTEIRETQFRLREAQRLGPLLAKLEDIRSQGNIEVRETLLDINERTLRNVEALERFSVESQKQIAGATEVALAPLLALLEHVEWIRKIYTGEADKREEEKGVTIDPLFADLLSSVVKGSGFDPGVTSAFRGGAP